MSFTSTSLSKAKEHIERIRATAARAKEHAERGMGIAIAAVETGGTAAAFGYIHERYGTADKDQDNVYTVASVDADLGTAVAFHGAGFFGAFGKYSEHAHNVANGALAAYGYRQGAKYGRDAKKNAGTTTTKGAMHEGSRQWTPGTREHANARRAA